MSKTSSKWWSISSRRITASACARVPLVRMSLRPGSSPIAAPSSGFGVNGEWSISMHHFKKLVRNEPVFLHQAAHRRTVAPVVILLQPECLVMADVQEIDDEVANARVDLVPQFEMMRIKRVVEIEHPGFDPAEPARRASCLPSHRLVVAIFHGQSF